MKIEEGIKKFIDSRRSSKNLRPNSLRWYNERLGKFAGFLIEHGYTELPTEPEPVEEYLDSITSAPETRRASFRAIRALYRFLAKRRGLPNPMSLVDPPICPKKVMPTLEAVEMAELCDLADNLRDRALLTLLRDNGTRAGEVASLRKDGIGAHTIRVTGKTGERYIPISEETRGLLLELVATNGKHDHVFLGQRGPLTPSGVYQIVQSYMIKSGISAPKQGPHRMRHGFAKNFLKNGGDLRTLQEILGHADISTTAKYLNLNMDDIVEKHQRFTPLHVPPTTTEPVLREVEKILKASRSNLVGVTKKIEEQSAHNNGEAKELVGATKGSDGASKWVTPLLPGLDNL